MLFRLPMQSVAPVSLQELNSVFAVDGRIPQLPGFSNDQAQPVTLLLAFRDGDASR